MLLEATLLLKWSMVVDLWCIVGDFNAVRGRRKAKTYVFLKMLFF
jgi:hypothetical protein